MAQSRWALWFRSLFSVLDFSDFLTVNTPWWTLSASAEVRRFLSSQSDVRALEWGSGASTVWLDTLCESVVSIESDPEWANSVRAAVSPRTTILTPDIPRRTQQTTIGSRRWGYRSLDFSHYVSAVDTIPGEFDLIVIDGRARESCFYRAITRLAPGGVIVFDNTNRRRYRKALRPYRGRLDVTCHRGLTPIMPWPTETTLIRQAPHSD